jgi:hypothetical protein
VIEAVYFTESAFTRTFPSGRAARKLASKLDGPLPGDLKIRT